MKALLPSGENKRWACSMTFTANRTGVLSTHGIFTIWETEDGEGIIFMIVLLIFQMRLQVPSKRLLYLP